MRPVTLPRQPLHRLASSSTPVPRLHRHHALITHTRTHASSAQRQPTARHSLAHCMRPPPPGKPRVLRMRPRTILSKRTFGRSIAAAPTVDRRISSQPYGTATVDRRLRLRPQRQSTAPDLRVSSAHGCYVARGRSTVVFCKISCLTRGARQWSKSYYVPSGLDATGHVRTLPRPAGPCPSPALLSPLVRVLRTV